jgi:hypothetical protein
MSRRFLIVSIGTGQTPLTTATRKGHIDVVKLFVEAGADLEANDHGHDTPVLNVVCSGSHNPDRPLYVIDSG